MFNVAVGSPKPPKGNRITDGTLYKRVQALSLVQQQIINIIKMSHKLTYLKLDNESSLGGKGKSTKKRKVKAGAMTKKELKKFFGHSFPPMPKKEKAA